MSEKKKLVRYTIDSKIEKILPALSETEYKALEKSLVDNGYQGAPIIVWRGKIIDGHNRYKICLKHKIKFTVQNMEFKDEEEAITWMIRQQLSRRSLSTLGKIEVAEKQRPYYTKLADTNRSLNGGDKKSEFQKSKTSFIEQGEKINVVQKLAEIAQVSTDTYYKGVEILKSKDQELIKQVKQGDKTINKAVGEIRKRTKDNAPTSGGQESKGNYAAERKKLKQIQRRYDKMFDSFQEDCDWLLKSEFLIGENDEAVIGETFQAEFQDCMELLNKVRNTIKGLKMKKDTPVENVQG